MGSRSIHKHGHSSGLDCNASTAMASYRENDTGEFLQQFTNSVSRALHKQNCTCNGRTYTADELKLKSNPAIYAPNFLQRFGHHPSSVAPENGANASVVTPRQQRERGLGDPHRPKHKSEFEFEPAPRHRPNPARVKKLGQTLPKKRPQKEADLPDRLDVIDKSGQNWQIVHQFQKKPSKRLGRLKPLTTISQTIVKSLTPPSGSQFSRTRTLGPSRSDPEVLRRANRLQDDGIVEQKQEIPESNPPEVAPHAESCRLQVLEFDKSPRATCASSANHGTSPADVSGGDALNPTVQETHRPTHVEAPSEATVLPPVFTNDSINRAGNHNQTGRTIHMRCYMEGISSLPSLDTNACSKLNHYGGGDGKPLPLELQNLYKRGSLKVSTLSIDMDGVLPENFLHREKNKLRQIYPMYDWRVGHETREQRERYGNSVTNTTVKEVMATASTIQLPATFPASYHENHAKDRPRFAGKEWKRPSLAVKNERGRGSQRLDTVRECAEVSEEIATTLQQSRVMETAMELRPNSSFFPRQPPPTPMDARRNRTEEIKR